jgi:hypothetical protein
MFGFESLVAQQNGVYFLMKLLPSLLGFGNLPLWKMLLDKFLPPCLFFITAIDQQVNRKANLPTHIMTGHQIVTQRVTLFGVMVVSGHVLEQTSHMLTQRIIYD